MILSSTKSETLPRCSASAPSKTKTCARLRKLRQIPQSAAKKDWLAVIAASPAVDPDEGLRSSTKRSSTKLSSTNSVVRVEHCDWVINHNAKSGALNPAERSAHPTKYL